MTPRVSPLSYPSNALIAVSARRTRARRSFARSDFSLEWVDRPVVTRGEARAVRDAAQPRGTSAHAKPSADDFERSLSRVMPDVMCGTCAEAPAAVVRVESQTGVALCACARCDTRCARARCVADSNAAVARHPWVRPGLARAARRARARAWTRARRDRCAEILSTVRARMRRERRCTAMEERG